MTDDLGVNFQDGTAVFREGDPGDCMYVIREGRIRISKRSSEGDVHIATLGEGDIFGEMALFDRQPRSATATALGPARLLKISRKTFLESLGRDPTLAFNLLEAMSSRTRRLNAAFMKIKEEKFDVLRAAGDLEGVCRLILEEARETVDADNGSIMLLDPDGHSLEIAAAFGTEQPEKMKLKLGDGIAGRVLESGQAQMINNVSMNPMYKPGGPELKSIVCVPLISGERRLGVLNLSSSSEKLFTVEDLKFIQMLASYSVLTIQNALDFKQLREATEALALLVQSVIS